MIRGCMMLLVVVVPTRSGSNGHSGTRGLRGHFCFRHLWAPVQPPVVYGGPMASFIVLLRGVNVGGITIRMADLRRRLAGGGFAGVQTVLASGNVLVESPLPSAEVGAQIQQILR